MTSWRKWALVVGAAVLLAGLLLLALGRGPMLLILGAVMIMTSAAEPVYGRATARPTEGRWRQTDERFVDPETGKFITVWFDPASGERRYVKDAEPSPPA